MILYSETFTPKHSRNLVSRARESTVCLCITPFCGCTTKESPQDQICVAFQCKLICILLFCSWGICRRLTASLPSTTPPSYSLCPSAFWVVLYSEEVDDISGPPSLKKNPNPVCTLHHTTLYHQHSSTIPLDSYAITCINLCCKTLQIYLELCLCIMKNTPHLKCIFNGYFAPPGRETSSLFNHRAESERREAFILFLEDWESGEDGGEGAAPATTEQNIQLDVKGQATWRLYFTFQCSRLNTTARKVGDYLQREKMESGKRAFFRPPNESWATVAID